MTAFSKSAQIVVPPCYHSRLWIVVARELRGFFLYSKMGWFLAALAALVVPYALYMTNGAGALSPQSENLDLRRSLPGHLIVLGIGPILIACVSPDQKSALWEPLLVTAMKRRDLIFGRLLAVAFAWFGISLIAVLELALVPRVPALVSWRPFLGYFHPDFAFFARLTLAWTICGCSVFALFEYAPNIPDPSPRQFLWAIFLIPIVVSVLKLPRVVYLSSLLPMVNTVTGINAAFVQLPLDPRVLYRTPLIADGMNAPHLWLITVIGASVSTMVLSMLTVRSLDRGMMRSDAGSRTRESLFDRVSRFFGA